jgi:hypothetical protein
MSEEKLKRRTLLNITFAVLAEGKHSAIFQDRCLTSGKSGWMAWLVFFKLSYVTNISAIDSTFSLACALNHSMSTKDSKPHNKFRIQFVVVKTADRPQLITYKKI